MREGTDESWLFVTAEFARELESENQRLRELFEPLRIQAEGDGKEFKSIFECARKSAVYWIEYCSLLEEERDQWKACAQELATANRSANHKLQDDALAAFDKLNTP